MTTVHERLGAGPADYRRAFPALYDVERLHRFVDSHGVVHVRDAAKGDWPLCRPRSGPYEPGCTYGGTWELADLTCHVCIEQTKALREAAAANREAIEAELRGHDATRSVIVNLVRAAGGSVMRVTLEGKRS